VFGVRLADNNLHPLPFPVCTALLTRELASNLDDTRNVNLLRHKKARVVEGTSGN